jgi:hypothetical protein
MKCHLCKDLIQGKYLVYDGWLVVCSRCQFEAPKCWICGIPLEKYEKVDGKVVCSKCRRMIKRCSFCNSHIFGRYKVYEKRGLRICEACFEQLPKCSFCQIAMKYFEELDGRKVCYDCLKKLKRCTLCGTIIIGRYWVHEMDEEKCFCESCYNNSNRCALCDIPLKGNYEKIFDKFLCLRCFLEVPKCDLCRAPILSISWQYGRGEGRFCDKCHKERSHCEVCGVPVGERHFTLSDGRIICIKCHSTSVTDIDEANSILRGVAHFLREHLSMYVNHSSSLQLVSRDELQRAKGGYIKSKHLMGLFKKVGNKFNIYILYGLPKSLTSAVLAHEYSHAWQAENCPANQGVKLREGFAEWVSYKVLSHFGYKKEVEQMERRVDVYGEGFKFIRKMEMERGIQYVFNFVKSRR